MEIERLHIKNYRSIEDSNDILFTKLFSFIGKNNTGKSSILKAIEILFGKKEASIDDFHNDSNKNIEIEATLKNFQDKEKYRGLLDEEDKIHIKYIAKKNDDNKIIEEYYLNDFTEGKGIKQNPCPKKLPEILVIEDIRNPRGEATGSKGSYLNKLISQIEGIIETQSDKIGNLKDKLQLLRQEMINDISDSVTEKFREIMKDDNLKVKIFPQADLSYSYDAKISSINRNNINILSCGTGWQSIYILSLLETYAAKAKNNDAVLLVEEPEVYLHPELQRRMFSVLRDIAEINQVIYTTHSPIMISDLWLKNSVKVVKLDENGNTNINELKVEEVIDELGVKYEDIFNSSIVIFVEGESDKIFFKKLIEFELGKENCLIDKIKFIPSEKWRGVHYYAFVKIITSDNVRSKFKIIIDSDGKIPEERKKEFLDDINGEYSEEITNKIEPHINVLARYSIESYLLDEGILAKAFPELSAEFSIMINEYSNKYKEFKAKIRSTQKPTSGDDKITLDYFQAIFRPKNLFSNKELKGNTENYRKTFSKEFLEIREKLIKNCLELEKERKSYIEVILEKAGIDHVILKEPLMIIKDVLVEIKNI
jgi:predicted ATP-dependent endonuclease of OLD family